MPTGYTAKIADGITFNEFILDCARAFGALITMRDEPFDTPIPDEFKPSDYHLKQIESIEAKLDAIPKALSEELDKLAKQEYEEKIAGIQETLKEKNELHTKYSAMLDKVNAWQPPSPDHTELKNFMIKQITESIDFDCDTTYWVKYLKEVKLLSGEQWKAKEIARLTADLAYHQKEKQEEINRTNGRNRWIKQLHSSLK